MTLWTYVRIPNGLYLWPMWVRTSSWRREGFILSKTATTWQATWEPRHDRRHNSHDMTAATRQPRHGSHGMTVATWQPRHDSHDMTAATWQPKNAATSGQKGREICSLNLWYYIHSTWKICKRFLGKYVSFKQYWRYYTYFPGKSNVVQLVRCWNLVLLFSYRNDFLSFQCYEIVTPYGKKYLMT
jgi:hypothetical protein